MLSYSELKRSEKRSIATALDMESGYVLDFSNRTIEGHFEDEFGIEFYSSVYSVNGDSKAKRLRTILESLNGAKAAAILKNLWEVRETLPNYGEPNDPDAEAITMQAYFKVVARLEGNQPQIGLVAFTFRSLSSFRQPFVRRPRGFYLLTTSAGVVDCRTH